MNTSDHPSEKCANSVEYYEEEQEEEDDTSIGDEEDNKEFGIYQCLPVDEGEPDWSTEEPLTVEEYLRRVRYEARQLPNVVTSSVEVQEQPHTPSHLDPKIQDCPAEYKPSTRWLRAFLDSFAALRQQLQREHEILTGHVEGLSLRVSYTPPSTSKLSSNSDLSPTSMVHTEEEEESSLVSSFMPELLALRGLDQVTIVKRTHAAIKPVLTSNVITLQDASNIYAVSARIEKPIHGDICALYRSLLRCCAAQRAALPHARHELLPHINIMIAIAGAYFGQDEELAALWEEMC